MKKREKSLRPTLLPMQQITTKNGVIISAKILTGLTSSTTAFLTILATTICIVFFVMSEGTPKLFGNYIIGKI